MKSTDSRSVLVFGLHESLLNKVTSQLRNGFAEVSGTVELNEVINRLRSDPPDLLVIGGGVPSEMRQTVFKTIQSTSAPTLVAEPRGPDDVLASIDRIKK